MLILVYFLTATDVMTPMMTSMAISSISVNPFSSDTSISLFISTPDQQITASGCRVSQFLWFVFFT
jgi:uncharacterized membrane protein YccF (DUF307 family)